MPWFLIIGAALTGWTLLLLLSSERQRQLNEMETKRQQSLQAAAKAAEKSRQVPAVG